MVDSSVQNKITDIFSSISGYDKNLLSKETQVRDTGVNSITIIQIMVKIEQEFCIEIDDEDLDFSKIIIMEDLFNVVIKKL